MYLEHRPIIPRCFHNQRFSFPKICTDLLESFIRLFKKKCKNQNQSISRKRVRSHPISGFEVFTIAAKSHKPIGMHLE